MKKFILIAFLFAGCKKEKSVATTAIHVVEPMTNVPVSGATVSLFRCNFGCPFGPKILFSSITDENGICQVPSENYNDTTSQMNVTKTKYWPFKVQKNTTVAITPEGWLQLRIHKVGNYEADSRLLLHLFNQSGSRSDLTDYNTATDSLILVKAFGSQQNEIDWQVVDVNFNLVSNGTLNGLQVPRFDTLKNSTLDY